MSESVYHSREETLEDLGRKGFRMIQRKDGFRFGEDTVLLSYFAAGVGPFLKRGTKALELGSEAVPHPYSLQPGDRIYTSTE